MGWLRKGKGPQTHTSNTEGGRRRVLPPRAISSKNVQLTSFEIMKFAELSEPYVAILLLGHFNDREFIGHLDDFQQSGQNPGSRT